MQQREPKSPWGVPRALRQPPAPKPYVQPYLERVTKSGKPYMLRGTVPRGPNAPHDRHLRLTYGITYQQFSDMLASQQGVCAICHQAEKNGRRLHVDHDHATGVVRALLCSGCNTALGSLGESMERINRLVAYLESHAT